MSNRRLNRPSGNHFWHATTIVATPIAYPKSRNFLNAMAPSQLNKGIS
jgi:hypothetical protein